MQADLKSDFNKIDLERHNIGSAILDFDSYWQHYWQHYLESSELTIHVTGFDL